MVCGNKLIDRKNVLTWHHQLDYCWCLECHTTRNKFSKLSYEKSHVPVACIEQQLMKYIAQAAKIVAVVFSCEVFVSAYWGYFL